jgi:hypothetical protein
MRIGVIDLLGKEPPKNGYSRFMRMNNASIMPQVIAVWCEQEGHDVYMAYYSGSEHIAGPGIPADVDLVFITAFSQASLVAYAMSNYYRQRGVITVLGGPHARSYPEDAQQYFDYVVGMCDKELLCDILNDAEQHRPLGEYVSATRQPHVLPGLRERWKFLQPAMEKAKILRLVPMIGSLGCPYKCSFCIDAVTPYVPLDYDVMKDDIRFFQEVNMPRSCLVWHDPNFGIRFDEYLDAIEEATPRKSITFFAEMSLALLNEKNLKRLRANNFKGIAPGIESWFDIGDKSRMRNVNGMEKVRRVAEQANLVNEYIPYTQCNLIFGLDSDDGPEPFELTKRFVDLAPGMYPHLALLSAFGRNAELNLQYQRDGRVLPVPFHFLDLVQAMNVKPRNYGWVEFYKLVCDTFDYCFSFKAMARRTARNPNRWLGMEQFFRGWSSERNNRMAHHLKMLRWLQEDAEMRDFFDGRTPEIPSVMKDTIRRHLGPLWEWLPENALHYDPNAYLHSGSTHPLPVALAER